MTEEERIKERESRILKAYFNLIDQYNLLVRNIYDDIEKYCVENTLPAGNTKVVEVNKLRLKLRANRAEIISLLEELQKIH